MDTQEILEKISETYKKKKFLYRHDLMFEYDDDKAVAGSRLSVKVEKKSLYDSASDAQNFRIVASVARPTNLFGVLVYAADELDTNPQIKVEVDTRSMIARLEISVNKMYTVQADNQAALDAVVFHSVEYLSERMKRYYVDTFSEQSWITERSFERAKNWQTGLLAPIAIRRI